MKRMMPIATTCAAAAAVTVLLVHNAASQPRVSTTRQLQVLGAAATNQSHGAWFVDLQSGNVVFCERSATGVQCHTAPIP
jgi:hypothetical protein